MPEPPRLPADDPVPAPTAKRRRPAALIAAPLVFVAVIAVALAVAAAWGDAPGRHARTPALAVPAPTGSAPTTWATNGPPRARRAADVAGPLRVRMRMPDKNGGKSHRTADDAKDHDKRHGKDGKDR